MNDLDFVVEMLEQDLLYEISYKKAMKASSGAAAKADAYHQIAKDTHHQWNGNSGFSNTDLENIRNKAENISYRKEDQAKRLRYRAGEIKRREEQKARDAFIAKNRDSAVSGLRSSSKGRYNLI